LLQIFNPGRLYIFAALNKTMNKIINVDQAIEISRDLEKKGKKIVIAGGCFDVLHVGHFSLFEHSKKEGDILIILLESDDKIRKKKGLKRPLHLQKERAYMLSQIASIDYVVLLPKINSDSIYDNIVKKIKPSIIATTKNDPNIAHKKRQAEKIGAFVKEVIEYIPEKSSSNIIECLLREN